MTSRFDRLSALALGAEWTRTRRAFALAGALVVAGATVEYLLLRSNFESGLLETLHEALLLDGYLPEWHAAGALFVVGLAALHAALNEGYLPSVALGWSPVYGNLLWTIGSVEAVGGYSLDPVAAFERTFPEAVALATLGFVVGLGFRRIRERAGPDPADAEPSGARSAG